MSTEPRMDAHLNPCRWCEELLIWADGPGGERIPLTADPAKAHEVGTWAVSGASTDRLSAAQPTRGQAAGMTAAGVVLYSHHGLTCPDKEKWFKAKDHGAATRRHRTTRR